MKLKNFKTFQSWWGVAPQTPLILNSYVGCHPSEQTCTYWCATDIESELKKTPETKLKSWNTYKTLQSKDGKSIHIEWLVFIGRSANL